MLAHPDPSLQGSHMFYALSWLFVFVLIGLWSLGSWALHAITVWTVSNAGALGGQAGAVGTLALPDWLAPWIAPEWVLAMKAMLAGVGPLVESVLAQAPALAGVLSVAVWVVWGIGCVVLVLIGALAHGLIAMLRRGSGPSSGGPGVQAIAR